MEQHRFRKLRSTRELQRLRPQGSPSRAQQHTLLGRARESPSFQRAPPETGSRFLSFPSQHFLSCLQTHSSSAERPLPALTAQAPGTHGRLPRSSPASN